MLGTQRQEAAPAGPLVSASTLEMTQSEFTRIRQLIYQRAGISLHEGKHAMVFSRLTRRLKETGHTSFSEYLNFLESGAGQAEFEQFTNALTTNLTAFFREEHHFHALHDALSKWTGPLRLWCCAASTGEEPYSLAMVIAETLGVRAQARIVATDIDTQVLATARSGVYPVNPRGLSAQRMHQFFLKGVRGNEGRMRVKPDLARMIEFRPFNLISGTWPRGEPFDMIFCRNVMIYFDERTQREVLRNLHGQMKPGGLLFVGHSENFTDATDLFRLRGKTIYERV
ncbi:CheR family methyltransferase [Amphibiibacter pelophylacis]